MKRSKIVALCMIAAFSMSAAVTASASAVFKEEPPEVGRCLKLTGGKYKDGNCKSLGVEAKEKKYEWYPGFGPNGKGEEKLIEPGKRGYKAVSKEGTIIRLETVHKETVSCKKQTSEGELTGAKTNRNFNIVFTGCESAGFSCISTNPKASKNGEIWVKELLGEIGTYKKGETVAKDKLANRFFPESGEILTEFECSGLKLVVKGEVMVPIKTNVMVSTQTVKFTSSKGKQKPERFATEPVSTKHVLFAKNSLLEEFFQAGQTLTTIQSSTSGEKVEASTIN